MIPIGSAKELAKRMIWCIKNPEKIRIMGLKSRAITEEKFDVRKVNNDMLNILGIK